MTHLSDFLHQIHAYSGDWVIIELGDDQRFAPTRCGEVLFYVLLEGAMAITTHSGGSIQLLPSDVTTVFGGIDHQFETGRPTATRQFDYFSTQHDCDIPPLFEIGAKPAVARLLIGKIGISWPVVLRPAGLPSCLHLRMASTEAGAADCVALFTRACSGTGASAYLTKLAELAMLRTLRENVELLRRLPPDATSLQIARARKLIDTSPGYDWSVAHLAREVGMSRSSFAQKFVEYTGKRPMEVVTEARMRAAADLLESERTSIADISYRIGYRSEAAFSRRFEHQFGFTPGKYRMLSRQSRRNAMPQFLHLAASGQLP